MKITIKEDINVLETQVTITCNEITEEINKLNGYIQLFNSKITAKGDNRNIILNASDIYYIEVIDKRTFIYTLNHVYEANYRLYEIEEILDERDFFRASKSLIINLNKIISLKPQMNRTIEVVMDNSERIYVSRQYSIELKKLLGIRR